MQGRATKQREPVRAGRTTVLVIAMTLAGLVGHVRAFDVSCADPETSGGDWPRFRNQFTGDGVQENEFLIDRSNVKALHPVWTFDANEASGMSHNEITGYPIEADGCIYVGTSTGFQKPGWVFAINADTGEGVWRVKLDRGIYSSLAVADGLVFAFVSKVKRSSDSFVGGPYVVALDQNTGTEVWRTTVDFQIGSDAVSSPIVYDGMVWVGVSGTAAEISEEDRGALQGSTVLLEAATGEVLKKSWTIPPEKWDEGFAGGSQWGTIAIDPETSYGYVGTGNPFDYDSEYETTNAVLKIDLARDRDANGSPVPYSPGPGDPAFVNPEFGEIVGSYKGNIEEYNEELVGVVPCDDLEGMDAVSLLGVECLRLDVDFGAQPNIFRLDDGRKVVGIGQKSGVYHVFDAATMEPVWQTVLGVPSLVGGIVGSAAFDEENIYGPHTIGGYLWSIDRNTGDLQWVSPTFDAVHWGNPVTLANGVLYTVDLKGFLDAYDPRNGAPLLHRPLNLQTDSAGWGPMELPNGQTTQGPRVDPMFTWGGVTLARHTVFASVGVGLSSAELDDARMPNGYVIAFRPLLNLPPVLE